MPETRALLLLALSASLSLWPRVCSICSEWMNTHDKTLCEAEISFSESRNPPHFRSRWEEKSSRPAWQLRTKPGGQEILQDQPEGRAALLVLYTEVDEKHGAQGSCACLPGTTETYLTDSSVSCFLVQTSSFHCCPTLVYVNKDCTWRSNSLCVKTTEESPPTSLLSHLESFVESDAYVSRGIMKQ